MRIILESEQAIRLEPTVGPLTIEAATADLTFSAFHMLASSLGVCAVSVLYTWADHADLPAHDLTARVSWSFTDEPHRVGHIDLIFTWPSLPPERAQAAKRAAELCGIHNTFTHPPEIDLQIKS